MKKKNNNSKERARGYSRTSGTNYTSIDSQKESEEKFIALEGLEFTGHYVDECKSGASVAGRDDYQQAIKDLMNDEYDILVPYDISRFGRDGLDIIRDSEMLRRNFSKYVVDSKGQFDNRSHHKVAMNYMYAGSAEGDRLNIIDRCIRGRKAKAAAGEKWCGNDPLGREWDDNKKKFVISEYGKKLQKALPRYADGESLRDLAIEYGLKNLKAITRAIRKGQLSGTYYAVFNAPDIDIVNEKVAVPGMPEIVTPAIGRRLKDRLAHNTRWTKQSKKKYLLSGFVRCAHCGRALKAQTQDSGKDKDAKKIIYYRHYYKTYYVDGRDKQSKCMAFRSIRGNLLESSALGYLYSFFLDKPAFKQAIDNALPSKEDYKALEQDINENAKELKQLDQEELKLFTAWDGGMKKSKVSIDRQNEIIKRREFLQNRRDDLIQTRDSKPNPEAMKQGREILRWKLMRQHCGRDWRQLPYDEVRKFLHYLFGDNPKKYGYGIFVGKQNGQWVITFSGCVEFYHDVIDGKPEFSTRYSPEEIDRLTAKLEQEQKDRKKIYKTVERCENVKTEIESLTKLINEAKRYQQIVTESKQRVRKAERKLGELSGNPDIKPNTPNS